jgi:hypothetical protein
MSLDDIVIMAGLSLTSPPAAAQGADGAGGSDQVGSERSGPGETVAAMGVTTVSGTFIDVLP